VSFLDDYEPVEVRLEKFWKDHPFGRIVTDLLEKTDGDYIVKAQIFRESETNVAATGIAHDSTAALPANMKSSALEVCETSAIGRALANLGYAPKGKRPSREEMQKASGGSSDTERGAGKPPASPGDSGQGAVAKDPGEDRSAAPCPHTDVTGFKGDDTPLPKGFVRCLGCGFIFKEKAA
jgi:hypothetical protein